MQGHLAAIRPRHITAALLAAAILGTSASPALADDPSPQFTPENAAQVLPPGYTLQGDDYVYDDGNVIVTPAAATASKPCKAGWLCLYEHADWKGHRWMFREHRWQDLTPYGANDQVSSWRNYERRTAYLGWHSIAEHIGERLTLSAGASSHYVGSHWNDQASSVLP